MHRVFRWAALALCLAGCKKQAPARRFCDQDLSGVWLNSMDRHFAYRLRDHGGIIRGEFVQRGEDGGLTAPDDPIQFEFVRREDVVKGTMRSTQRTQGGRDCPVEFGIDLTACAPDRITAVVEMDAVVGEDCRRRTAEDGGELPTHRTEYVFVRGAAHPSDGGEAP